MKITLEDGCTHFNCDGCNGVKLVSDVHKAKVARNVYDSDTQKKFQYRPYWVMLCTDCFEGREKKEEKKNDGDNNS
jgi:hypothetical protein